MPPCAADVRVGATGTIQTENASLKDCQNVSAEQNRLAEAERERLLEEALDMLDFPQVRKQLASETTFPRAGGMALSLTPSYNANEVARLHEETAEAAALLQEGSDIALRAVDDVSAPTARAAKGGLLTGHELLAIAEMLDVQGRARTRVLSFGDSAPILAAIASGISDLSVLRRRIAGSIGQMGEVLDGASPGLRPLRRSVRQAYESAANALARVVESPGGAEALQDSVVSIRSDRLVVQVKANHRHRVPGVVHGASNTGATLFVEPFATVELGNRWRELVLEEQRETERVLWELSEFVGQAAGEIESGVEAATRLDFIMARARYGARSESAALPVDDVGDAIRLTQARHPLLGGEAVPVNLRVGPGWTGLVVTGPNMGGKTAALKTVGLLAVMHQCGMPIPAEGGSALPVFDGMFADIGDLQDIQQSASSFGSHVRNLAAILRHATQRSLVLLDELGASTDPDEGSAIAKAVLNRVASLGAWSIATTHHRSVAVHAEPAPGLSNASVELDPVTLRPTYHITPGVPGRSYAIAVAEQVGLPREILDDARSLMEPQHVLFEDWLLELQASRRNLKERIELADRAQAEAEASRRELESKLEELEASRADVLLEARKDIESKYEEARRGLRRARAALSWSAPPGEPIEPVVARATEALDATKQEMAKVESESACLRPRRSGQPVAAGDLVDVRGMSLQGVVEAIDAQGEEADVSVGSVRLRVALDRLTLAAEPEPSGESQGEVGLDLGPVLGTIELDLRGMQADDASIRADEFLDRAVRDGLSSVRIVHGKGTGVLRRVVRELLDRHPLVKSFRPETPMNGGSGATSVELT